MISSILQTLSTALGDLMDVVLSAILNSLDLDLGNFLTTFPILEKVYSVLQGFAVGMTVIIAGVAIAKYWLGSVEGTTQELPPVILGKAGLAILGIYEGGYVLEFIVGLGKEAFDKMLALDAVKMSDYVGQAYFSNFIKEAAAVFFTGGLGLRLILVMAILQIILWVVIAWNIFKLVVEVFERWLMVGVLVYTSPLVYCTISSPDTIGIFKRWTSMFVGSVMQMSLSVMFLKMIVSGFNMNGTTDYTVRLLLILAMCKIAQRLDTYLQQLGVGVGTTGGNMVDDVLAGMASLGSIGGAITGKGGGSRSSILGDQLRQAVKSTSLGQAVENARQAYRSGKDRSEVWAAAKAGMKNGAGINSPFSRGLQASANAVKQKYGGTKGVANKVAGDAKKVAEKAANTPAGQKATAAAQKLQGTTKKVATSQTGQKAAATAHKLQDTAKKVATSEAAQKAKDTAKTAVDKASDLAGKAANTEFAKNATDGMKDIVGGSAAFLFGGPGTAGSIAETLMPEDYAARQEALASMPQENRNAVDADSATYQTGKQPLSDELKEQAAQAQKDGKYSKISRPKDNFQNSGVVDENGHLFNAQENGDVKESLNNAATGTHINSDGTMTDSVNGDAVAENLAMLTSRPTAGAEASMNADREADQAAVNAYEASLPGTSAAMESGYVAPEMAHGMALSEGESRVAQAREQVEAMDANGVSHDTPEYQAAVANYQNEKAAFDNYKQSYDNLQGGGYNGSYGMQSREEFVGSTTKQSADDRQADAATVDNYQASAGASNASIREASAVVSTAENKVRSAGSSSERVQAMSELKAARTAAYTATVTQGAAEVEAAKAEMSRIESVARSAPEYQAAQAEVSRLESSGVKKSAPEYQAAQAEVSRLENDAQKSPEYQAAKANYEQKSQALENYKAAYGRQSEVHAANETYNLNQDKVRDAISKTVESADVYTLSRALNNPNFTPADLPATRRMAERVYADGIPDMMPGSSFRSVQVRNLEPRVDAVTGDRVEGGRETRIEYVRKDGSVGYKSFYNLTAATAMPKSVSHTGHCVYTAADGSMHLTTGDESITVPPAGNKQVRMDKSIRNHWLEFMGLAPQKPKRR